jgi:hypothetical protein
LCQQLAKIVVSTVRKLREASQETGAQ